MNMLSIWIALSLVLQVFAFEELFAVLGTSCATSLSYGPQPVTLSGSDDGYSNYLSTSTPSSRVPHNTWLQIVTSDGVTELFRIYWTFENRKTLADRIVKAVQGGELVNYRVIDASNGNEFDYVGKWRFSEGAVVSISPSMFSVETSSCCLSPYGGVWGAGSGNIDGQINSASPAAISFWGVGNWHSESDALCTNIYKQGVSTSPGPNAKTYLYVVVDTSPSAEPTAQPTNPTAPPTAMPTEVPINLQAGIPQIGYVAQDQWAYYSFFDTYGGSRDLHVTLTTYNGDADLFVYLDDTQYQSLPGGGVKTINIMYNDSAYIAACTSSCKIFIGVFGESTFSVLVSLTESAQVLMPTTSPTVANSTAMPTARVTLASNAPTMSSSELFAVLGADQCAEGLYYGPQDITTAGSADGLHSNFFSTSTANRNAEHREWTEIVTSNGTAELFRVYWSFRTPKTLAQRFSDAVAYGEVVQYRVVEALTGNTFMFKGVWWFSYRAGDMLSRFDHASTGTTTCCFSSDDGAWGAGNGTVDGDSQGCYDNGFWGVGNWNSTDARSCSHVFRLGVPEEYSASKTYMYYHSLSGGVPHPTRAPTPRRPPSPTAEPTTEPSMKPQIQMDVVQEIAGVSFADYSNDPDGFRTVIMQSIVYSITDLALDNIQNFLVTAGPGSTNAKESRQLRGATMQPAIVVAEEEKSVYRPAPGSRLSDVEGAKEASPALLSHKPDPEPARRRSCGGSFTSGRHSLASSSASITVSYTIVLPGEGHTFAAVEDQLIHSVESGQFDSFLHAYADANNVPALEAAISTITSTENSGTVTTDDSSHQSQDSSMQTAVVVGIVVGAVVLVSLAAAAFYFVYYRPSGTAEPHDATVPTVPSDPAADKQVAAVEDDSKLQNSYLVDAPPAEAEVAPSPPIEPLEPSDVFVNVGVVADVPVAVDSGVGVGDGVGDGVVGAVQGSEPPEDDNAFYADNQVYL